MSYMNYEERLEVAKRLYELSNTEQKTALECIFPELRESEDEKIRKAILELVRQSSEILGMQNQSNMLAWLEKQVSPDMVADAYLRGCNDTEKKLLEKQVNPSDINPSEFDLRLNKLLKQFETLPKEELASSLSFYLNVVQNNGTYKQGEQKSINYNEELKKCRENPLYFFDKYVKLEEQKPAWSEEDEVRLQACIDCLQAESLMGKVDTAMTNWLKSLKQKIKGE